MSVGQEECMSRIEPLLSALFDSLHDGMTFYQDPDQYSAEAAAQHRGKTQKGCVYDHAFHSLRERVDGKRGHHFLSVRGLELLNYFDIAVIRLKQVNGNGKGKTIPQSNSRIMTIRNRSFPIYRMKLFAL